MTPSSTEVLGPPCVQQRILGRIRAERSGPTVIVMTGIHGNEPAGGAAAERVLERLGPDGLEAGELVVLRGNLSALSQSVRYLDNDLNRQWTPRTVARLHATPKEEADKNKAEDRERRALLKAFTEIVSEARAQVYFLDMHTSSADGAPFLTVGDTLRNRRFARQFPLPLILGLEEQVDGSLLEYLNNFGFITMGVEGGQHDAPVAVRCHEAVLTIALVHTGLVPKSSVPDFDDLNQSLRSSCSDIPRVLEVRHRHVLSGDHGFRMDEGFENFQPIRAGQRLAEDAAGPIHASETGRLLLPLYQGKGDDGFFIAREFSPFWLSVSARARRLRLAGLVRFLPGVRPHPDLPDVLLVNTRLARICPLEIFHLLGFRKLRRIGNVLAVSRRRYDLTGPTEMTLR